MLHSLGNNLSNLSTRLVVGDDYTNAQGGPIDREALQDFMDTTGLTPQQLIREDPYQQPTLIFTGPVCQ